MTRFLNPSKIVLLASISLYAESLVPDEATIPVLSFIAACLLPPSIRNRKKLLSSANASANAVIEIEDFHKVTFRHGSAIPGRTLWDLLLKKLWDIKSLDVMHMFFDSLPLLLSKPIEELQRDGSSSVMLFPKPMQFSRKSLLGIFIRRAQLEFTRLQLHDGIMLWRHFVTYRSSTLSTWRRRNPTASEFSFDTNLVDVQLGEKDNLFAILYQDLENHKDTEAAMSTEDVEKLLEFQRDRMQTMGIRLPQDMKKRLEEIGKAGITVPSLLHYVKFLDAWRSGDYPSSFDNLHRYFDYTMHNRDRTFYQYALLNLAILQKDFGCFPEAMSAIHETISAARENKDIGCLNYSLSWLYHLAKAYPEEFDDVQKSGVFGTDKEALAFLKAKSKEAGMWSLLSTSLLGEAKLILTNGESLASALENITKASFLNLSKQIPAAIGSTMGMQSSLFSRLGISYVAWSFNELFLQCYATNCPADDFQYTMCKSATALVLKGRYDEALRQMNGFDEDILRNLKRQQQCIISIELVKLRRSLHRNDLSTAMQTLSQIRGNRNPDQDTAFVVAMLGVQLEFRKQNYNLAIELIEMHAKELQDRDADVFHRVKLMSLKARLYDKAGLPQKGFSVAVRAACLAYRARLLPLLWEAVGALCRVLISLNEFEAAARLLGSIMPQVLENEDCDLTANSFIFLADAHMGMAGQMNVGTSKRKEHMTKAMGFLERSFDEFSRVEDLEGQCEALAKKATILHLNGDLMLANDCAAKYLGIRKAAKEELV